MSRDVERSEPDPVVVWFNPRCSKCVGAEAMLNERGVPAEYMRYLDAPPPRAELERVLDLLGLDDPRELMRTGEALYAELSLDRADRGELIEAMLRHPVLIERPVVIRGDRAVIARPPERLLSLLDDEQSY